MFSLLVGLIILLNIFVGKFDILPQNTFIAGHPKCDKISVWHVVHTFSNAFIKEFWKKIRIVSYRQFRELWVQKRGGAEYKFVGLIVTKALKVWQLYVSLICKVLLLDTNNNIVWNWQGEQTKKFLKEEI